MATCSLPSWSCLPRSKASPPRTISPVAPVFSSMYSRKGRIAIASNEVGMPGARVLTTPMRMVRAAVCPSQGTASRQALRNRQVAAPAVVLRMRHSPRLATLERFLVRDRLARLLRRLVEARAEGPGRGTLERDQRQEHLVACLVRRDAQLRAEQGGVEQRLHLRPRASSQ